MNQTESRIACSITIRGRKFCITSPRTGKTLEASRNFIDTIPGMVRRMMADAPRGFSYFTARDLLLFLDAAKREASHAVYDAMRAQAEHRQAESRRADPTYQSRAAVAFDQSRRLSFAMARGAR